jgi:hypothetical protein
MITKQTAAILVLAALLSACRSSDPLSDDPLIYPEQEQESAFIPTYSKNVVAGWPKGRSLDPRDVSRVRLDEQVHAYHLGRLPSHDRQEMHEAHTVYRVEQDSRWDTRLPATPMDSRGVVLGIRDPSRKEIPDDDLIKQERQALAAKSDSLRKSMSDLEVLRAELLKKKAEFQKTEKDVADVQEYLAKTLQERSALQAQLKQAQERINEMEEAERLRIRNSSQNLVPKK